MFVFIYTKVITSQDQNDRTNTLYSFNNSWRSLASPPVLNLIFMIFYSFHKQRYFPKFWHN